MNAAVIRLSETDGGRLVDLIVHIDRGGDDCASVAHMG